MTDTWRDDRRGTAVAAVVSGEGVELDLPTAGVASRMVAAAIDLLVEGGALLVLVIVIGLAAAGSDSDALGAVAVAVLVLILAGYPITMEWLCRGRTVGKMAMGLRVVRDDGGPIGFRHALIRGLAGLVLEKPGVAAPILGTFAGMATAASHPRAKRIGDLMAGTVVLNERAAPLATASPFTWVPDALVPWALSLDLSGLDERLAHSVRTFVSRAWAMSDPGRESLGEQLRGRVLAVVTPAPPPGVPTPVLLQAVLSERRRRDEAPLGLRPPAQPFRPVPWGPRAAPQPGAGFSPPA